MDEVDCATASISVSPASGRGLWFGRGLLSRTGGRAAARSPAQLSWWDNGANRGSTLGDLEDLGEIAVAQPSAASSC